MPTIWRNVRGRRARAVVLGTAVLLAVVVLLVYFAPWDGTSGAASYDSEETALALLAGESRGELGAVGVKPGLPRRAPQAMAGAGPGMGITLTDGGFCSGGQCYAATSSSFTLAVEVLAKPAADYVLVQTYVDYGVYDPTANEDGAGPNSCGDGIDNGLLDGADRLDEDCVTVDLVYSPTGAPQKEIVWPDLNVASAVRGEPGPALLSHGGITNLVPPLPESSYVGIVVELQMICSATATSVPVVLLPYDGPLAATTGSVFVEPDGATKVIPKLTSITMNCVDKQAYPGDTDGDGCSDVDESGSDPVQGGDRDWLNPWDFYDVASAGGIPVPDGIIDLPNDILGVSSHLGSAPGPPYDVHYDRGPWGGLYAWNDTALPDGVIDSPSDVNGVLAQFGHDCR